MRLLNTETKEVEDFISPPAYAILSHRWRNEEVTLEDLLSNPDVADMKGYAKLSSACDMALQLEFDYLWMDTCCIDKTSSAELSEAINSMYMWYKRAALCIAFLDDVKKAEWESSFGESMWFSRGWTLQELIAPAEVLFVDKKWEAIGTKTCLASQIKDVTNIEQGVLITGNMDGICVAKKMSWAANRKTTRIEDQAYSLMGLFDVNMPTIYGEGPKAFIRLQEEILRKSDDQSLFAWGSIRMCCSSRSKINTNSDGVVLQDYLVPPISQLEGNIGLLAPHPSCFEEGNTISRLLPSRLERALGRRYMDSDFTVTNHGIRIRLPVQLIDKTHKVYVAYLACATARGSSVLIIYLRLRSGRQFSRIPDYYDRPALLRVRLSDVVTSELLDDYIYVQGGDPRSWSQNIDAAIDGQSVLDFCKQWSFTLLAGSPFLPQSRSSKQLNPVYWMSADTEVPDSNNIQFFVLESESMQSALLVVTTLDGELANKSQKECALVRAFILGRHGDIPYNAGQSTMDIYESWCKSKYHDTPASPCVMVTLPDRREVLFTMRCEDEPSWTIVDGPTSGRWKLSATILEPRDSGSDSDTDSDDDS